MKKTLLKVVAVLMVALVFSACSGTKNGTNNVSRGKISNTWVVSQVSLQDLLVGSVQSVFDMAPYKCMEGSIWKLTNSGNGSIQLNNPTTGCPMGFTQTIYWSFSNSGNGNVFQFKKIYEGDKPKNVEEGYKLYVTAITTNTMVMKSAVNYGGKVGYVVYSFVKQ